MNHDMLKAAYEAQMRNSELLQENLNMAIHYLIGMDLFGCVAAVVIAHQRLMPVEPLPGQVAWLSVEKRP